MKNIIRAGRSRSRPAKEGEREEELERQSSVVHPVGPPSQSPPSRSRVELRRTVHPVELHRTEQQKHGGEQSALSSLKLHYANEKSGSEDEMGSYCLSDAGLTAVGEGFTKLDKLSLIWCSNVTSAGLKSIAEKCSSLRSLDLQRFH